MGEPFKPAILLVLLLLVLVLFGSRRLPGAARSLGQSLRIVTAETQGLPIDEATRTSPSTLPDAPVALPPVPESAPLPAVPTADVPAPSSRRQQR